MLSVLGAGSAASFAQRLGVRRGRESLGCRGLGLHHPACASAPLCASQWLNPLPIFGPQVKEAALELGYQPDETFCLKVSQLREIFEVRWSVFLLGPAGCGKTAIWRTLMRAQNNAGEKTVRRGRGAGQALGCDPGFGVAGLAWVAY